MTMNRVSTPSWRARESTSRPETSGMRMSTSARSKSRPRSASSASAPLGTLTTVWPSWVQARSSTQRIDSSSSATSMVPGWSGSGLDMVLAHGEGDAEAGAAAGARLVRDDPAMLGDDSVADRQAQPGAARLGGEEGREEMALRVLRHTGAVVRDGDGQELIAVRAPPDVVARLDACGDDELPVPAEGVDRVPHQVEEHLRQLGAVAEDGREARVELGAQSDVAKLGSLPLQGEDVVQDAVDVERRDLELRRRTQSAQLLDEPVEPVDLTDDDVGGLHLRGVAKPGAEQLRGTLDAAQRVPDLVRQPESHGAHRGEPVGS